MNYIAKSFSLKATSYKIYLEGAFKGEVFNGLSSYVTVNPNTSYTLGVSACYVSSSSNKFESGKKTISVTSKPYNYCKETAYSCGRGYSDGIIAFNSGIPNYNNPYNCSAYLDGYWIACVTIGENRRFYSKIFGP